MLEQMADKMGMDKSSLPNALSISPELTRYEIETINPRLWVHPLDEGSSVAGDRSDSSPSQPLDLDHAPIARGKTVLRLTDL